MLTIEEFQSLISEFNNFFFEKAQIEAQLIKKEAEAKQTAQELAAKAVSVALENGTTLFYNYLEKLISLKAELEESRLLDGTNTESESIIIDDFYSLLLTINSLNKLIIEYCEELNNYSFEKSKVTFSFSETSLEINDTIYNFDEIPSLNAQSFDTDDNYKEIVSNLYAITIQQIDCVNQAIHYLSNESYSKSLEETFNNTVDKYIKEVEIEIAKEKDKNLNAAKKYYQERCVPVLKENLKLIEHSISSNFDKINLGFLNIALKDFETYSQFIVQVDTENLFSPLIKFPINIDLEKEQNIIISTKTINSRIKDFLYPLIKHFINGFPIKLILINDELDPLSLKQFEENDCCRSNFLFENKIISNKDEFQNALASLKNSLLTITEKVENASCSDIFDFNQKFPDNQIFNHLFVFTSLPNWIDSESIAMLKNLLKDGYKYGFYSIIVIDESNKSELFDDTLLDNSFSVKYDYIYKNIILKDKTIALVQSLDTNDLTSLFGKR